MFDELPDDHPFKNIDKMAKKANAKLDKATDKLVFEYNQVLFDQNQELRDTARDEADYNVGIMVRTQCEIACCEDIEKQPSYIQPLIFRQIAEALMHKADGCERMMKEIEKVKKGIKDDLDAKEKDG